MSIQNCIRTSKKTIFYSHHRLEPFRNKLPLVSKVRPEKDEQWTAPAVHRVIEEFTCLRISSHLCCSTEGPPKVEAQNIEPEKAGHKRYVHQVAHQRTKPMVSHIGCLQENDRHSGVGDGQAENVAHQDFPRQIAKIRHQSVHQESRNETRDGEQHALKTND